MIETGKKELVYTKEVSPGKLYEEIYASAPELARHKVQKELMEESQKNLN